MQDLLQYIPEHWVGFFAMALFIVTMTTQLIEKYPQSAKALPLGSWWHNRAKRKRRRTDYIAEDNEVIASLDDKVSKLVEDMQNIQAELRCFRAWSVYDARWHHRVEVINAARDACVLPKHYDYFEFETIWQRNPQAAENLSVVDPEDQPPS